MSSNRSKALFGFGAIVAVLIVAFVLWPSNFRKEDASGAIGAVQKHHAPQIKQQDVVLGDESVKQEQKVLYGDFLADATKLRAMAQSRDLAAAREFGSQLQSRYLAAAEEALAEAEVAARTAANRQQAESRIAESRSILANRQLSDSDMQALNSKIAELASMEAAESAMSRVEQASRELADVDVQLASAKMENQAQAAARELADVEQLLSRSSANISLADRAAYLNAMEMESRSLQAAEGAEMSSRLAVAAESLEARAQQNIDAGEALASRLASELEQMQSRVEAANRSLADEASMVNSRALLSRNLGAVSEALASRLANVQAASREFAASRSLASRTEQLNARQAQ